MSETEERPHDTSCPRCGGTLVRQSMRTAIWQGDRLAVVEDVPAHVCQACLEQYYDDAVSDALRALNQSAFPESDAVRTIEVPVFTLKGLIREPGRTGGGAHVDY